MFLVRIELHCYTVLYCIIIVVIINVVITIIILIVYIYIRTIYHKPCLPDGDVKPAVARWIHLATASVGG